MCIFFIILPNLIRGVVYIDLDFVDNRDKKRRDSLAIKRLFNEE